MKENDQWKQKFCIIPKRSSSSNKLIWFRFAYFKNINVGTLTNPVIIQDWLLPSEYTFFELVDRRELFF